MNRIYIFNWLPIADNMLPEINFNLASLGYSSKIENDSVLFDVNGVFSSTASKNISVVYHGKINQRGFSQVVLELTPIHGMSFSSILNDIIPQFQTLVANLINDICPFAVRNKFAVIHEGIVSFQDFESSQFQTIITHYAITSLKKHSYLAIQIDSDYQKEMDLGFDVQSLHLSVPSGNKSTSVFINKQKSCFLFYSPTYMKDESYLFDNIIYKYFAFLAFSSLTARVIEILKDVRDHIVPLRRRLSIALQRRTEEYLETLSRAKKYLTYVNIKLPVVYKVINHLTDAYGSAQFKAKIDAFSTEKISSYPAIQYINRYMKGEAPSIDVLVGSIIENVGQTGRLQDLYSENEKEVIRFSTELSEILEGSFLSENVLKLTKVVQTLRNQLEVARGGKHRENALKGLSILLFANFGVTIVKEFDLSGFPLVLIALAFSAIAWYFIETTIRNKKSYFQIEIPINKSMDREALRNFTRDKDLKRSEIRGESRQKTWAIQLFTDKSSGQRYSFDKNIGMHRNKFKRYVQGLKVFDLTLDYEKHGYVHSVQLETEYKNTGFDYSFLVFQIVYLFMKNNVNVVDKDYSSDETSLYVELLSNLDINVDPDLKGLNSILRMPKDSLEQAIKAVTAKNINRDESALSRDDTELLDDIVKRSEDYLFWLLEKHKTPSVERELYGEKNLQTKADVIRQIKTS